VPILNRTHLCFVGGHESDSYDSERGDRSSPKRTFFPTQRVPTGVGTQAWDPLRAKPRERDEAGPESVAPKCELNLGFQPFQ
jgi:hypothetical protein